jgi:DNA mismatch endonuclease, patch repair protein
MDTLTRAQRSARMALVQSRDTRPEIAVRRLTHSLGYRYRIAPRGVAGRPDLTFSSRRRAIFVHGCFWHRHRGCPATRTPKTRRRFWEAKFEANIARDRRIRRRLSKEGWRVLVIWECQTKDKQRLSRQLTRFLGA